MSASLLFKPVINAVLPSNEIAASAELYSYKAGSTVLYPLYLDEDNASPATNPVIADASGEFPPLFTDDGQDYKLILREASVLGIEGAVLWEIDNYGRIGRTNEIVAGSLIEDFYGLDASIGPNLTVIVPIASDEILKNPQEGVTAVESWKVPPSSRVILQLKDETIVHPARIAEYAMQSSDQVELKGVAPLIKNIADNGHSYGGTTGDYSVTFKLDNVNDVRVGHYVNILDNDEFQANLSKRSYVEYDQARPRWVFTEIQAATPNSATVPEGFVRTEGTTVTILYRVTASNEYFPSEQVDASDYITAGEVFFVNGQMREIESVSSTGPTFELASALEVDLGPQTYWYTLTSGDETFTQEQVVTVIDDETAITRNVVTGSLPDPETGLGGTRFTDYQIGDFHAHDGGFNPIRAIISDSEMDVAVDKTVSTPAKFSIVRSEGAFAGLHPITAVDTANSTITFHLRAYYLEDQMAIPIKGITGGVIKIVRSVLETTGTVGGIFVDGRSFTYGDLVIKGPQSGVGIDPKGQSGFNAGRVTFQGAGGTYGFNIGVDFGVGCVGKVQEQINFAAKFSGMRCDNSIVEADFAVTGGAGLYGVLTNNSNTNFNFARQNGNKTQGYLAATPCNTVADSMRQIGNRARSVVIQAGSFHLVQFTAIHCGQGPQLVNSNGRMTGCRVFGGRRPLIITGGSTEANSSTFTGFEGSGLLVQGGTAKLQRAVVVAGTGAAFTSSNGATVDFTSSFVKDTSSFIVTQDSYVEVSGSNIEPSIAISAGGSVDATNMGGTLTCNRTPNTLDTSSGSILRT
ncbi:MAG: hypothetical protein ABJN69_13060 [Hellea sp.]